MKLADLQELPPVLNAEQLAEVLGWSTWSTYESVKNGTCPVEPIRLGRCLRWPTARVLELLGIQPDHSGAPTLAPSTPSTHTNIHARQGRE